MTSVSAKLKLLLVDDDEEIRTQMKWALGKTYEVILAQDRASAVQSFRDQLPLVVGQGAPVAAESLLNELAKRPDIAGRVMASVRVGERRWNLRMKNGADVMLPEGHEVAALDRLLQIIDRHADRLTLLIDDLLLASLDQVAGLQATALGDQPADGRGGASR